MSFRSGRRPRFFSGVERIAWGAEHLFLDISQLYLQGQNAAAPFSLEPNACLQPPKLSRRGKRFCKSTPPPCSIWIMTTWNQVGLGCGLSPLLPVFAPQELGHNNQRQLLETVCEENIPRSLQPVRVYSSVPACLSPREYVTVLQIYEWKLILSPRLTGPIG